MEEIGLVNPTTDFLSSEDQSHTWLISYHEPNLVKLCVSAVYDILFQVGNNSAHDITAKFPC